MATCLVKKINFKKKISENFISNKIEFYKSWVWFETNISEKELADHKIIRKATGR